MKQKTIDEFTDYVDKSLEKFGERHEKDIYKFTSELAELIRVFYNHRKYLGISIEGYQGTGKTTLALLIAKSYYGDWNKAFKAIRFSIKDFISESLQLIEKGYRIPLRILDDFAFQGGSKWKREKELVDLLEYMNVIRTLYASLIFTYVDDSGAKFIRTNAKLKIILNTKDINVVEVRVYTRRYNVMGVYWKRVLSLEYKPSEIHSNQEFSELYREYWKNRLEAVKEKGKRLLEGLDTRKLRLFDFLLGYNLGKLGLPLRAVKDIYRDIAEVEFRNESFIAVNRLVKKKLQEYDIIEYAGTGNGKQK